MKRALSILVTIAALGGCATTPTPPPHGKVGVGSQASFTETIALSNATVHAAIRNVATMSTVSYVVASTGTASGAWSIEAGNDGTTFTAYTLDSSPPAAAGSPQTFGVSIGAFEYAYARLTFTGTGGSGSATVSTQMKGY